MIYNKHCNSFLSSRNQTVVALICSSLVLQACSTVQGGKPGENSTYDPCVENTARNIGAIAGGILGGVIAKQLSDAKSAVPIGLLVGGLIGAAIGKDVAKRECDLYKVAQKNNIQFVSARLKLPSSDGKGGEEVVGLSASLIDKDGAAGHFLPGSDQLTPAAAIYFKEIAASYTSQARTNGLPAQERAAVEKSKVLIVGHTDDQEDSARAAEISERRAKAVANVFKGAGVPEASIYYQGAGETLPIADNNVEPAKNRRVEIVDVANDEVMSAYLKSRISTSTYFKPVLPSSTVASSSVAQVRSSGGNAVSAASPTSIARSQSQARQSQIPRKLPIETVESERQVPAIAAALTPPPSGIDFGGNLFNVGTNQVNIGEPVQSFGFSSISVARADNPPSKSCVYDRPRISRSVKSLRDASEYKIGDYRPGAYGSSWVGMVNGHLVALNNVAVIRAGGLPASDPNVLIYKNFDQKGGASRKADYSATPLVNSYAGSKGLLYRVFFDKSAPVRCIDVVLPATPPFKAEQGYVYQDRRDQTFAIEFKPEVPARR